jgi:N-acetylglutamate synthase-like GNAT family acetyltransferase
MATLAMTELAIVEYRDDLAPDFAAINAEWIEAMFVIEPHDRDVLDHPRDYIIDPGGTILFVEAQELGIVGACALMPTGDTGAWELTKMGVRASARGRKAGEFLLEAVIDRACTLPIAELYLLTNSQCQAAVHLYEKAGFVHSVDIMVRFGSTYARCDVAMAFDLDARRRALSG